MTEVSARYAWDAVFVYIYMYSYMVLYIEWGR